MPEYEPRYGDPEVPQPSLEQVNEVVLDAYNKYKLEDQERTDWLVRPSNNGHHPAIWRHFQVKMNSDGWEVETAERRVTYKLPRRNDADYENRKAYWHETTTATFKYKNGELSSEHKMAHTPRPTYMSDVIYLRPKDVLMDYSDDTQDEAAQLLYYYFTICPPISKAEAVEAYRKENGVEQGEYAGGFREGAIRRIQAGSMVGRLLERLYLRRDPKFARYPKELS